MTMNYIKGYIKGYDGLRAISIILVIYEHISSFDFIRDTTFRTRIQLTFSGINGVMMFFVLSGFLITLLLMREKHSTGKINIRKFYIRRALRIFPPLFIFYLFVFLLMYFGFLEHQYTGLAISFFYLYNFVPRIFYSSVLGSTWSLGVEEQFYILWPLTISFFYARIVRILIFALALCWIASLYLPGLVIYLTNRPHILSKIFFVDRWFIPACTPILIGALFSYLYFTNQEKFKKLFLDNDYLLILPFLLYFLPLIIPMSLLTLRFALIFLQDVGIALLLLWIFFNQSSLLVKFLEFKPLAYTGRISYGIYVYQGVFIAGVTNSLLIQKFPLNLLLTMFFAILSYEFYEKPILKIKDRFSPIKQKPLASL